MSGEHTFAIEHERMERISSRARMIARPFNTARDVFEHVAWMDSEYGIGEPYYRTPAMNRRARRQLVRGIIALVGQFRSIQRARTHTHTHTHTRTLTHVRTHASESNKESKNRLRREKPCTTDKEE